MVRKIIIIANVFLLLTSCLSESENNTDLKDIYSQTLSYCEHNPLDIPVEEFSENYIPYCHLGIDGKTLQDVVELYGQPIKYVFRKEHFDAKIKWEGAGDNDELAFIFQNLNDSIPVHTFIWKPYNDKPIYRWIYFVASAGDLRAVYGMQLNIETRSLE